MKTYKIHHPTNCLIPKSMLVSEFRADFAVHAVLICIILLNLIDAHFVYDTDLFREPAEGGLIERCIRLLCLGVMVSYTFAWRYRFRILFRFTSVDLAIILLAMLSLVHIWILPWSIQEKTIEIYRCLFWIFIFCFMKVVAYRYYVNRRILQFYLFVLFIIVSLQLATQVLSRTSQGVIRAVNLGYDVLDFLPIFLFFLCKYSSQSRLKTAIFVLVGGMVLISLKRGAIIAFGVSWLVSILYSDQQKRAQLVGQLKKLKNFTIVAIPLCALIVVNLSTFQERFEDFGSSRVESRFFYIYVWESWYDNLNDDSVKWFGYGYGSVQDLLKTRIGADIYAHSDYLQFIHDYGLIGISVYLFFLFSVFSCLVQDWRHCLFPIGPPLVFCTVMFLRSIYSGLLALPQVMQLPAIFFGLWMGARERKRFQTEMPYCG